MSYAYTDSISNTDSGVYDVVAHDDGVDDEQ